MKVLFIHTYYGERGGEDIVYEAEVELLKVHGYEVESLIFNNSKYSSIKFFLSIFNFFSFHSTIRKIRSFRPELLHIHNLHFAASPSVIWAAKLCKIPVVITLHNYRLLCPSAILLYKGELFLKSLSSKFPLEAVKKRVFRNSFLLTLFLSFNVWFHKFIGTWHYVDRFITLSTFAKDIYLNSSLRIEGKKIVVKPNFVRNKGFAYTKRQSNFVFIGRLSEEKGIDVVFRAFEILKFRLIIIGDGPLRPSIKAFASKNSEVEFLGFQSQEVVAKVLQTSFGLLFCSKCYEGMPMTILESLANGTPVIASSLGCIPDIISHEVNGFLFENNNADDLANKIKQWLELPLDIKEIFYQNSRNTFCNRFSEETNFSQLSSIYHDSLQT